jgi:hypothetical protein
VRGLALLLLAAVVWADEDPWTKAERNEFEQLFRQIQALKDPRWRARAYDIQRQFKQGVWSEKESGEREVHCVALFRGSKPDAKAPRRARAPTQATVQLNRQGPVVLVLCGYESVEWTIEVSKGVRLERVLVLGRQAQLVRGVSPKLVKHVGRMFVLNRREASFAQLEAAVAPYVQGARIKTYVGAVDPDGKPVRVGPGSGAWRRQMLLEALRDLHWDATRRSRDARLASLRRFVFPTLIWNTARGRVFCDCTAAGSIRDTMEQLPNGVFSVALDPETGRRYYLSQRHVEERDRHGGRLARLKIPNWFGGRIWSGALAFDSRRRRLVMSSMNFGLAAYDLESREWQRVGGAQARRANFVRLAASDGLLSAFCYDPGRDCFWALHSNRGRATLHRLDALGQLKRRVRIRHPLKFQPGTQNGATIHPAGEHLVLIAGSGVGRRGRTPSRSLVLSPDDGTIFLQAEFRRLPRLDPPARRDWDSLWANLKGGEPYGAMRLFARGRAPLVEYLRRKWEAEPMPAEEAVRRALKDLGARDPEVRSRAFAVLSEGGPRLIVRLEAEVARQSSPEVRLALRRLLSQSAGQPNLRARLLLTLERVNAPGAETFRRQLRGE